LQPNRQTKLSKRVQQIKQWFAVQRDTWLKKRIPPVNQIQLNINNTFILPSSFGWACIGIVLCLFILGTNFQNNIILLLCYFMLAILLLSVFHSFFYFIQHKLTFLPIIPDFENRQIYVPVQIDSTARYAGGSLYVYSGKKGVLSQQGALQTHVKVPLLQHKRGIYDCPRVSVLCTYGFGLFKCWTHISPKLTFVVYPSVKKSAVRLFSAHEDAGLIDSSDSQYAISDNLQGVREYQPTDPIHHVSWKHVAKGQGMLTKDFSENKGVSGWLRIQDLLHLGREEALRCLCYQVQQMDKDHVQFGLDLGVTQILPQQGKKHLEECLTQLALYPKEEALDDYTGSSDGDDIDNVSSSDSNDANHAIGKN
jgi:uncharacterized protein (DUF58 family)